MTELVDLSVSLRPGTMETRDIVVRSTSHVEAARALARREGIRLSSIPRGRFFPTERLTLGSHSGTHLDAPYHFYPTSEGRPARRIDEVPLEWTFADGHVLDFRGHRPDRVITEHDVADQLATLERSPAPGDIILSWTGGTDGYDHDPLFAEAAAGMNAGAVAQLFERGLRVVGVDSATIDVAIPRMVERFLAGDVAAYFPVHRVGRLKEWTHAEKLTNFGSIPGRAGFKVALFPVKLQGATGAWTRAAALLDPWLERRDIEPVDVSLPILSTSFEPVESQIVTRHHDEGRRIRARELKVDARDIVHASAMDTVTTYTQAGTHVCAPWFFAPERDGRTSMTIDQVPLGWLYADAVLLDFDDRAETSEAISLSDIKAGLDRIAIDLTPGMIVLLSTGGANRFLDDPGYADRGPRLAIEAFTWLLDQGIRVIGSDAESLDGPVRPMLEALASGQPDRFFPLHHTGADREFCLINKLDLRPLTSRKLWSGFKLCALPIKLEGLGAAWTRAVALVDRTSEVDAP